MTLPAQVWIGHQPAETSLCPGTSGKQDCFVGGEEADSQALEPIFGKDLPPVAPALRRFREDAGTLVSENHSPPNVCNDSLAPASPLSSHL
jgi:hypothetical protein